MAQAPRDQNFVPSALFEVDGAPGTVAPGQIDQVTGRVLVDAAGGGSGTVTSVSVATANGFAGSVATPTTTPAITLSTTLNTPVLAGNGTALIAATTTGTGSTVVLSGSPALTTPSIAAVTVSGGILTFPTGATDTLVSRNSTDTLTNKTLTAPVMTAPVLGTPASGTVTNLTGTASININGTVGATTPSTGVFTTLVANAATSLLVGTAGSTVGSVGFRNATSGTITLAPVTGALGTVTLSLPAATDQLVGRATTDTLTNKTLTAPRFADLGFIADANGNELIRMDTVASAVNQIDVSNNVSGQAPFIQASGDDANINLSLLGKGTGRVFANSIEVATITGIQTLQNKRNYPRTDSTTSAATLTPDLSVANVYYRTTQTVGLTINAPIGSPFIGETIAIYVDSAGAQTLTMNAAFIAFGSAFPASTTAGKTLMIVAQYNGTNWKTTWANAV